MFDVRQLVLWLASFIFFQFNPPQPLPVQAIHGRKSVAVVGAGSAGLAMLRALVELQDSSLDIVLYEQRWDVGGIWLPDTQPVHPPDLPETPLYPQLRTNVPAPTMTFPNTPFPPGTPLFPSHKYAEEYLREFAICYNLIPYIRFNHTVLSASWVGSSEKGRWDVVVANHDRKESRRSFDHLVVANGHNHYPHIPFFSGQDEWLRHSVGRQREILHSIFFREPERYSNQTVVVVGSGESGSDVASHVVPFARKVYQSVRTAGKPVLDLVEVKPEIAYFTPDAIVFADGSRAHDVDSVILGTGYDLRIPFLEVSGELTVKPNVSNHDRGLTTNLRYLFPLHQHIFSLSPSYPPNALAFIGLPILVSVNPSTFAQSTYAANAISNASLLGSREELEEELVAIEDELRLRGYDPYQVGHRMVIEGSGFDYQNNLIERLKEQGAIPNDGKKYVEAWRREAMNYRYLKRGWKRVEALRREREWLSGVETELEWAELMKRLNDWQKHWETAQGLVFPEENHWQ